MRIFLDENLSEHVADALNSLNKGYFPDVEVISTKIAIGIGEPDEIVIPRIAGQNGILVTRDYDIKRTRSQFALCKQHGLGIIFIRLPKNDNRHWELVKALIKHWQKIITSCSSRQKPFAFRLDPHDLRPMV